MRERKKSKRRTCCRLASECLEPRIVLDGNGLGGAADLFGGVVSGTVFEDFDGDGIQGPGEVSKNGVAVALIGADGSQTTKTNGDGFYSFDKLANGDYLIEINESTIPNSHPGLQQTADHDNVLDGKSDFEIDVSAEGITTRDFGYQPMVPEVTLRSVIEQRNRVRFFNGFTPTVAFAGTPRQEHEYRYLVNSDGNLSDSNLLDGEAWTGNLVPISANTTPVTFIPLGADTRLALPHIRKSLVIDGEIVVGGQSEDVILDGTGARPFVVTDGRGASGFIIHERADQVNYVFGTTISNMQIQNFRFNGIVAKTQDNLITGNTIINNGRHGINIASDTRFPTVPDGNIIGTSTSGNVIFQNGLNGIQVSAGDDLRVESNTISENGRNGVNLGSASLDPFSPSVIRGNEIAANIQNGIRLFDAGGLVNVSNNVIEDNLENGVFIDAVLGKPSITASDVGFQFISANGLNGILVSDSLAEIKNQVITDNGPLSDVNIPLVFEGDGIRVVGTESHAVITHNEITGNFDLGIDLSNDGVTVNDVGDPDDGPNRLQNFPALFPIPHVRIGDPNVTVVLDTLPGDYRVEFFRVLDADRDPTMHGEATSYVTSEFVTVDTTGPLVFSTNVGVPCDATERGITATLTRQTLNHAIDIETSEFSLNVDLLAPVICVPVLLNANVDPPVMPNIAEVQNIALAADTALAELEPQPNESVFNQRTPTSSEQFAALPVAVRENLFASFAREDSTRRESREDRRDDLLMQVWADGGLDGYQLV